jgi:hypothetical protein
MGPPLDGPLCLSTVLPPIVTPLVCVSVFSVNLETALRNTEAALEAAREKLREAAELVESLEIEQRGLKLALARHQGPTASSVIPAPEQENWQAMTRAAAVETMLRRQNRAMGPTELSTLLVAAGRENDNPNYIAATLGHLKQRQRVRNIGHGKWVLAEGAQPSGSEPAANAAMRRYGASGGFPVA